MEQISIKYINLKKAFTVFAESIAYYQDIAVMPTTTKFANRTHEELLETAQRSLIQAFEVLIDVFWKHLKWLLEAHFQIAIGMINPRNVINKACEIRFLSETDATLLCELIDYRNKTSHIYKQEIADFITQSLLHSWKQIAQLIDRCDPQNLRVV